MIGLKNVKEH